MLAKDVMEADPPTLAPDATLRQAVASIAQSKRGHGLGVKGMAVLDEQGRLVGMLSLKDVMRTVIPAYMEHDLGRFSWDEMLEQRACRVRERKIAEIMSREVITIHADTPLMTCVDLMIKKNLQRLPVVNNENRLIGMVYIRDLYQVIADVLTGEI